MILYFLILWFTGPFILAERVIHTTSGPIQGFTVALGEPTIEAFLGVPYAEPPTGRLRFMRPVPKTHWEVVYNSSRLPPACVQNLTEGFYFVPDLANVNEDCLYLNLWVPYMKNRSNLRPVIVFFHGGAFNHGSSNMRLHDGARLATTGDSLVVTINYRVGALGFLSAFTEDAPGNMGLHDLVLATRWVKKNAEIFGGDPDNVVLMGNSAGAYIATSFLLSPLTRNLFRRVIAESGAFIHALSLEINYEALYRVSQKFARLVGCANKTVTLKNNPKEITECLKQRPIRQLSEADGFLFRSNPLTFMARVGDDFMPVTPVHTLKSGQFQDMELLIGVNADEGNHFLWFTAPQYFGSYGHDNVKSITRRLAGQITTTIFRNTEQANPKAISEFYMNIARGTTSDDYTNAMGSSLGDYMVTCNTYIFAEIYSLRNPVYFYVNKRRPSSTPQAEWVGTTHMDELQYVFGNPIFGNFTAEEVAFSERVMRRWIAFVKTGNPNVEGEIEWPLFTRQGQEYLVLDDEEGRRARTQIKRDHTIRKSITVKYVLFHVPSVFQKNTKRVYSTSAR